MSEELEADLRRHALDDCGGRFVPTHVANIAADQLKRYREALAASEERFSRTFYMKPDPEMHELADAAKAAIVIIARKVLGFTVRK